MPVPSKGERKAACSVAKCLPKTTTKASCRA